MPRLEATSTHYIKLGRGGQWEAEAIRDGVLRFGYRELSHDLRNAEVARNTGAIQ